MNYNAVSSTSMYHRGLLQLSCCVTLQLNDLLVIAILIEVQD